MYAFDFMFWIAIVFFDPTGVFILLHLKEIHTKGLSFFKSCRSNDKVTYNEYTSYIDMIDIQRIMMFYLFDAVIGYKVLTIYKFTEHYSKIKFTKWDILNDQMYVPNYF